MKLLLDTHTLILALQGSNNLPERIINLIEDENNEIYVSSLSLWEIAIKHKTHPESISFSASDIRYYAQRAGYIFLSLNLDSISIYEQHDLSMHKDPFDQMLICQSEAHNMKLVSHDAKLKLFNLGNVELF